MTNLPPNSPIDIRTLALYDIHQWKTTEKSYSNYKKLCEVLGNEAISYEEYETLFNKYLKESYNATRDGSSRDLPIPDIRGCIFSDVINGKPAEKSVNDLSEAFKNHKIDKEDHEYWYKRFANGQLFNRVAFSDFPEDVFAEIVEKCDIKSYLNLRNVSFRLRTIVDQLAPPCTDIEVDCGDDWIIVDSNDARITDSEYFDKIESQLPLGQIEKQSLKTLELLLSNPKLRLKSFEFVSNSFLQKIWRIPIFRTEVPSQNYKKHFFDLLNSLDYKIHAEKCVVKGENERGLIGLLQCLKPGTLEKLDIDMELLIGRINEVVKMDQWRMAKHLTINANELPPIENFFNFSTFELVYPPITLEDMVKLCENASKSNTFEHCKVRIRGNLETIKRVLNLQPTASPEVYSIPNSNLFLQFLTDYPGSGCFKIYKN